MTLYQRGKVWWYEFEFRGQRIRESSHSRTKGVAERIERERRRQLELGSAGLEEVKRPSLFSVAMKAYLAERKPHWSEKTSVLQEISYRHLEPHFSRLLVSDIKGEHISRYQQERLKEGASPRSINIDVALVRLLLKKHRRWANIQPDVRMLPERSDVGRALTADEQHRLLAACKKSHSRSLYPALLLSLHTGLRNGELRLLRWRQVGPDREDRHSWQEQDGRR
jgi:integrase